MMMPLTCKMIDFNAAIQVEDENGTRSRRKEQPEIDQCIVPSGPTDGSCGHALLHLFDRVGEEDSRLRVLATKLTASVAQERP